jgi:aspartate/methionine/tyrosine aminotransferase
MVRTFRRRRDVIVEGLNAIPGLRCAKPRGAFYAFPHVGRDGAALAKRLLEEAGVACVAGSSFGAAGKEHVRFSYAASEETIREALRRIRALLA